MAQKVQVLLTCDMDAGEKPAAGTVPFALDGTAYEIDLCDKHTKQLRDAVAPYVDGARRVSSRGGRRRRSGGAASDRERTREIRAWAKRKGIKVSERGRLSADVVGRYEASGGK